MWICTPFGILMPALRPAKHVDAGDNRTLQVRTRERSYLDTFRERYCPEMGESIHFPNHDYPWKAYVTPEALAAATAKLMLDIDYEKFKPQTSGKHGLPDKKKAARLHSCYNQMWGTQLSHGDGTSSYDKPLPKDPNRCKGMGHWWPRSLPKCVDCDAPRPKKAPKNVSIESDPKTGTWHRYEEKKYTAPKSDGDWWKDSPADAPAETPVAGLMVPGQCLDCGELDGEHAVWCLMDDCCPECSNRPHLEGCSIGEALIEAVMEAAYAEGE